MSIVRIPVPESWIPDKHYVIEFDTETLTGIELQRDLADIGDGAKDFTGVNKLTFKFDQIANAPRWVEVDWLGRTVRPETFKIGDE